MILARFLVLFLLVAAPASASARASCSQSTLAFLRAALEGNRLIQAENMLGPLRPTCERDPVYRALLAEWSLRTDRDRQAFDLYVELAAGAPQDPLVLAGAGRAAFELGRDAEALAWLDRATILPGADWRAWNTLAILHDRRRAWAASARAYEAALRLAPDEAAIWNNRGWSLLLQGRAADALPYLDRAFSLDSNDDSIRRNRSLALAMAGRYDDRRRPAESASEHAERLNNLGYAAFLAGDLVMARSLLARAIQASDVRFERAEANLARVEASLRAGAAAGGSAEGSE